MKAPLPVVRGVGPSRLRLPDGPWKCILDFLTERFPDVKPATWVSRMAKGEVVDEKGSCLAADSPCVTGSFIFYYRELERETLIPFEEEVLYEDDHILVADKPHFLPVQPSGRFLHETLLVRLRKKYNLEHLVPVHRIDRETAGIVIFSLNPATRGDYASLFQKRETRKRYEALARGAVDITFPLVRRSRIVKGEPFFLMKEVEGQPNAETCIDVMERRGEVTLYGLTPLTGRKHQLRIHLAALGIPIINDAFYPILQPCKADDVSWPLKLLAKSISFKDPLSGQERYFESKRHLL